jgi:hypothetical protein
MFKIKVLISMVGMIVTTLGLSSSSRATALYTPVDGDSRGYTSDGDWAYGYWKAECAIDEYPHGVSRYFDSSGTNPGFVHGLWCCGTNPYYGWTPKDTQIDLTNGDSRFSPTFGDDWDPGYRKAECDNYSFLTGIAQNSSGQALYGRCAGGSSIGNVRSCHRLDFTTQDNRSSQYGGDWDSGYGKNQCADDETLKGFSVYSSGKIKSIYCCSHYVMIQ